MHKLRFAWELASESGVITRLTRHILLTATQPTDITVILMRTRTPIRTHIRTVTAATMAA
jgi:hypothetical protein